MRFVDFVGMQMDKRGLDQLALRTRLRRASGYVSQIVRGLKPPPIQDLDRWADALEVAPDQLDLFRDLAELERTPPRIRQRYLAALLSAGRLTPT